MPKISRVEVFQVDLVLKVARPSSVQKRAIGVSVR
jgi:hypothetical protein